MCRPATAGRSRWGYTDPIADLASQETLTGGRLNHALARAVVQGYTQYVGRGPTKAQAFHRHNYVFVVVQDALTKGERSLAEAGRPEAVLEMRRQLQRAMESDLRDSVAYLTGCDVVAFMSDSHIDPDVVTQSFVLDRPIPGQV